MLKKYLIIIGLSILSLSISPIITQAQVVGTLDVSNSMTLSDSQIQRLMQQASAQGMTVDQAIQIAKTKGASQAQIDQLMKRITTSNQTPINKNSKNEYSEDLINYAREYSQKEEVIQSETLKRIFGHQLFNTKQLTFEPSLNMPLSDSYVLGVNDELTINVSGASQQTYQLTIDRNGAIFIPNIGPVYLLGMQFNDAKSLIKKRLTNIFRGIIGSSPNTWADVTVSKFHSIKVNVVGEVLLPGTYSLPAAASAFNALYLSGGPNENGSFRNIEVIRDGNVIKVIDVYDYLLRSDASSNISLRDQDVIKIRTYETRIELFGGFKRPGIYELKKGETLQTLFDYAGGFTSDAFKESVSLSRISQSQRSMIDVPSTDFNSFYPVSGDKVTAGKILDKFNNRVTINGAVFRPGAYALTPGLKLSELIAKAKGLKEDAFLNRGIIFRIGSDLSPFAQSFIVSDIQNGLSDIELQRDDSIVIQDVSSMRERQYIRIFGEVQKSGEYEFNNEMTLKDLIFLSGGLKESASESYIEVARRLDYVVVSKQTDSLVNLFQFKVSRDLKINDQDKKFVLQPFDYVYVRKAPSYSEQKSVTIDGEVIYPGVYSILSKNERISDLIERSGGLNKHAYPKGATLYRSFDNNIRTDTILISELQEDSLSHKAKKHLFNGRIELQLDKILKNPKSIYNYQLKDGDQIFVPEVSEEVRIAGAIMNPVGLAYESNRRANFYINRSGGFTDNANKNKVYVINSDGTTGVTKTFIFKKYPRIGPGSKIIVPEKSVEERVDPSMWLAIASTLASITVAIATILR